MRSCKRFFFSFLGFVVGVVAPSLSHACAVCFGQDPKSNMVQGFYWGVVVLLSLPFVLTGSLAGLIIFHSRKNKRTNSGRASANVQDENP